VNHRLVCYGVACPTITTTDRGGARDTTAADAQREREQCGRSRISCTFARQPSAVTATARVADLDAQRRGSPRWISPLPTDRGAAGLPTTPRSPAAAGEYLVARSVVKRYRRRSNDSKFEGRLLPESRVLDRLVWRRRNPFGLIRGSFASTTLARLLAAGEVAIYGRCSRCPQRAACPSRSRPLHDPSPSAFAQPWRRRCAP